MLNWFQISDPNRPGSVSIALASKEREQTLRDNVAKQNLICGPALPIEPTDDFWRFRDRK